MKFFILFLLFFSYAQSQILNYDIKPDSTKSNRFMNINILDSKELKFDPVNRIELSELSALAYKENKLFALSNHGYLYHFDIQIKDQKINKLDLINAFILKTKKEKRLKKNKRDAEGMVLVDDMLFISFERKPRVDVFSLNGVKIEKYKINKDLRDIDYYQGDNKALESIAYSEKYGVLTAPELPLKNSNENLHVVYAKNRTWSFMANGKLSALEFIGKRSIIALERKFNSFTRQRVITLTKVFLDRCENSLCQSKVLAILDSKKGWNLDNFEGLTKVANNRFLMVSDDNGSFFQKTLLVLFEIVE